MQTLISLFSNFNDIKRLQVFENWYRYNITMILYCTLKLIFTQWIICYYSVAKTLQITKGICFQYTSHLTDGIQVNVSGTKVSGPIRVCAQWKFVVVKIIFYTYVMVYISNIPDKGLCVWKNFNHRIIR